MDKIKNIYKFTEEICNFIKDKEEYNRFDDFDLLIPNNLFDDTYLSIMRMNGLKTLEFPKKDIDFESNDSEEEIETYTFKISVIENYADYNVFILGKVNEDNFKSIYSINASLLLMEN